MKRTTAMLKYEIFNTIINSDKVAVRELLILLKSQNDYKLQFKTLKEVFPVLKGYNLWSAGFYYEVMEIINEISK